MSADITRAGPAISRRLVLAGGAALLSVRLAPAQTVGNGMREAIAEVTGSAKAKVGRIKLEIPELVENGNAIPLTVSVESPMRGADRVESLFLFNEKNPQPHVVNFRFGPAAAAAKISTRIRLADAQTVFAIARMADGSFWSGSAQVIVTVAACVETL